MSPILAIVAACFLHNVAGQSDCPDQQPGLTPWRPGHNESADVIITSGESYVLEESATFRTLTIQTGGRLVFRDGGADEIVLRTRYIHLFGTPGQEGELHIGSETCPYQSRATISLYGLSTDGVSVPRFGQKVLAVNAFGVLEVHGRRKMGWTLLEGNLDAGPSAERIITLADNATSWGVGDRIVIASTDFDMNQAEEFNLASCPECAYNQVKISGEVRWFHAGQSYSNVDMRAEVGLLTRNVVFRGEMESACYGDNRCEYFSYDTFGGQMQAVGGYSNIHLSGIELYHMGQQVLGSYPIHFHLCDDVDEVGGYERPTYVRGLSIHNVFSRCVTIHRTDGILVEDVVGYDSLGHCYFLEDGAEQRNVLRHNLGLVTKYSSVLPSDRNDVMCRGIRDNIHGDYIPVPDNDCKSVATFWIAHPNNTFEDNASGGSVDAGFWFIFHEEPTGPSAGKLPRYHGMLSPMGVFRNNRAHSNRLAGLLVDFAVKVNASDANDPREFLARTTDIRYMPHQDADPNAPRVPAEIDNLIAYKNNERAVWVRGGDFVISNSRFADNGRGVTMLSDEDLPTDPGARQVVTDSLFVGETENRGSQSPGNRYWGTGGDGLPRSLPRESDFPVRGVEVAHGPITIRNNEFYNYYRAATDRHMSAIGFFLRNNGHMSVFNNITDDNDFGGETNRVFLGYDTLPGHFGDMQGDGDKMAFLRDPEGILGEFPGIEFYIVNRENHLLADDGLSCVDDGDWQALICSGLTPRQIFVMARSTGSTMFIGWFDGLTFRTEVSLRGSQYNNTANIDRYYSPTVYVGETYLVRWGTTVPNLAYIFPASFRRSEEMILQISYLAGSTFDVRYHQWRRFPEESISNERALVPAASVDDVIDSVDGYVYHWDNDLQLLTLKIMARYDPDGFDYCPSGGCERIQVTVTSVS